MAASAINASREAIHARYVNVEPIYAETRDIRLLGFVLFLISDVVIFSSFIFTYVYLRNSVPNWPPITAGGHQLPRFDVGFAAINSTVLFGSGATMHLAMDNWKRLNRSAFNMWLVATIILGTFFLLGQAYEWHYVTVTWAGSTMGAMFFTLTGLHGFHVFIGVVFLLILMYQANHGVYNGSKYFGLTAGTLYWHFVDVIWVGLFYLFYLW
ncbi:MAG: cytochrome c oxidase subunit 3 [Acidimicrobiales bacterium]